MAAVDDPLVMVLRRFAPDTLRDAGALDAALRSVPEPVAISDIHALAAAAYSGAVDELAARVSSGQPPSLALDGAADRVARVCGMSPDQARKACAALGIALGVLPDQIDGAFRTHPPDPSVTGPDSPSTVPTTAMAAPGPHYGSGAPQEGRPGWGGWPVTPPVFPPVGDQGRAPRRRFWLIPVGVFGALLVGGLVAGAVLLTREPAPVPPDPFAVPSVAERYGALGSTLLAGVTRCSPTDAAAGETERVRCEFAEFDLILSTHETAATLQTARDVALNTDGSLRSARLNEDVAALAMEETTAERSRVYWDVTQPRPMSATVSRDNTDLPDLIAWWDARGFSALTRPEVPALPKDEFQSDDLQEFAKDFLGAPGVRCQTETPMDGKEESVACTWANGVVVFFFLASGRSALEETRQDFLFNVEQKAAPGSFFREPTGWSDQDKPAVKQGEYSQYLTADNGAAIIYFDQDSTLCWAFMYASSGDLQRLREFWANGA